jgi:hypothetical protein
VQEQKADGRNEEQEQQTPASAALSNLLAPYPLATLPGRPRRGLDVTAELVVVPEPGDDVGGVLVGELVENGAGRLDEGADIVPKVVIVEQTLDHRLGPRVSRGQRRHRDQRVGLGLLF